MISSMMHVRVMVRQAEVTKLRASVARSVGAKP